MSPKVTIALSQHPLQFTPSPYSSSVPASATTLKAFPTNPVQQGDCVVRQV